MSAPRTVAFVIIGLDYAGAEVQLVEVIRRLRARGWRIFVISLITPAAFLDTLDALGVRVISLDLERGARPTLPLLLRFLREIRRIRPDVVHGHMVHSNLLARLSRLAWRAPVVVATVHSTDEGGRSRHWLYRLTERLGSVTTSVSEEGLRIHVESGASSPERIVWLPNGIDLDRFRPDPEARAAIRAELGTPEARVVWLAVARFHWPKDHPTLLRAFRTLPDGAELWLVGQGEDRPQVEALVDALDLRDRVRFLGVRPDVPRLLAAADGFVLSSTSEAMPVTLMEASATEIPCVTSDVGAARDLVEDGVTGFVVPPSDVAAMAAALSRVTAMSAAERRALGRAGRERVRARFGLEAVVDRWEALYEAHGAPARPAPPTTTG